LANALYIAEANGANATLLIPEDRFQVVDVPMFSPDGEWLYFSASERSGVSQTWWEILLGIEVAAAHNIPSDWWRMPVAGGDLERLTNRDAIGLYGEISTDGETILFVSTTGLYLMNADGSGIEQLLEISAAPSLSWVNK
jgi:Tol biopolymer transport system component